VYYIQQNLVISGISSKLPSKLNVFCEIQCNVAEANCFKFLSLLISE